MDAARIQARAVVKVVAIALVVIAAAVLLALIVRDVRTTLTWLFAAVFLALALNPAVDLLERLKLRGRVLLPRWLAILAVYLAMAVGFLFVVLHVIPPIVEEVEGLGSTLPTYVSDVEDWAEKNKQFEELNDKYNITATLSDQAKELPSKLGDAANEAKGLTVTLFKNIFAALTVLTMTFFLLLDGRKQGERLLSSLPAGHGERGRRIAGRIYKVVKGYVTVNLTLALAAGVFTWIVLELLGVELAIPLAIVMAFMDLVPLVGLTIGGLAVAAAIVFHDFPVAVIVWLALFLIYQQLQDRVIQPLMYRSAVQVHPVIAIVAILVGAQLLGVLGALLAIPTAAAIGVLIDESLRYRRESQAPPAAAPGPAQPEPAAD